MPLKEVLQKINFVKQCRRYQLSLWQCPSFLFLLMGLITILTMLGSYLIALRYTEQPEIVALIVILVAAILTIINYFIVQGFERLAQANQLKSEFVSIVSHQLRTPLTSIKWTLNLMMDEKAGQLTEEQLAKLKTIKESNQQMGDLINDLLNVSRIEQGRLVVRPEKLSLEALVRDIFKDYGSLAKSSNVKLSLVSHEDIPLISADRQAIKIVLQNLIDNAIRYIRKEGRVKIVLKKKNRSVICQAQDDGVGIPQKDQNKIFQKFFRSRNIMKYQTEGTGLGLFISQAIIKASGGKMGFQSRKGQGSVFWFELPIKPKNNKQ